MSRILAYTSPARGHLYPVTPALLELRARGHHVIVRTLSSQVAMLNDLGLDAGAIHPAIDAIVLDDWRARTPQGGLARSVATFAQRAPLDAEDLTAAIAQHEPDLVVVDINSWGAIAAAQRWGGPWAAFCPYPLALGSRDVPPFGPGLAPARGLPGRLRDRLLGPLVTGTLQRTMLPPVNAVRTAVGVPALRQVDDLIRAIPLLLYFTAEPFEYPRSDWPAGVVMVGPCPWEPASAPPGWLGEGDDPIVLVTTSSEFQDDGRLVRVALDALADEPVRVVATLPASQLPAAGSVPANARVEAFAPHGPLLARAVCAITHAGMGATQKALARGVPVVAVPFGRDQREVARRVEVAGAGVRVPASRLSAERLRAAVRRASAMGPGAARVARGYEQAGGPRAAADALERHLEPA